MRIVAADSSSAILNDNFEPLLVVAVAAVLVNPPYRHPSECLAAPIFEKVETSHNLILHEADLCRRLLERVRADVVHLDMTMGAISVEELSPIQFSNLKISSKAKSNILKVLPKLRKIAGEIRQKHGVDLLAIGKESIPVRIAELTSAAYAILYASKKALKEKHEVLLGLPSKSQPRIDGYICHVYSLRAAEHDITGYARDENEALRNVKIVEMLNPIARGFRALRITPALS